MQQKDRTPQERGAALDRNLRVRGNFVKVLDSWSASRTRLNLLLRLAALVAAVGVAASGLGVSLIRAGTVGLALYAVLLAAGLAAIHIRGEVITNRTPYWRTWNSVVQLALLAVVAVCVIALPADSLVYQLAVSTLIIVVFGWPIMGAAKALQNLEDSRQILALSAYLGTLPKDERQNAIRLVSDRSGALLIFDSKL